MRLAEPLRVGPLRLRNRVVFAAHLTNAAVDGVVTDQHVAYYAARAAGGAGLVITEEHSVHPGDHPYEKLIRGWDPAVVPGYRRLTAAVHAHGAPVLAQLNHNGGQSSGMYSREPVWAPSPVPDPMFREVPQEITTAGIAELVAGYATVARHCVAGGFDGVELQCSHASILRQFLSPLTNHRTDSHGGALEDRVRVVREALVAVRAEVGPDRVVGVRLCGDEGLPGGTPLAEMVRTAQLLEPHVDYVNTSIGVATATLHLIEASMHVEPGYALFIPSAVRRAVSVPVVGVGRFTTPAHAERALAEGHCDLVGVVRGQIADPTFASALPPPAPAPAPPGCQQSHHQDTRRPDGGFPDTGAAGAGRAVAAEQLSGQACIGCNQECVGRVGLNRGLQCAVNPRAGREAVAVPAPTRSKRVLVVGGGPGGLRAAATAAEGGHRVLLCEGSSAMGGQVALAAVAPGRAELGHLVRDLLARCRALGVEVRTGCPVDEAVVRREAPDAVVLATGATPGRPEWARGANRVVDVRDVLAGRVAPTGSVLVHDELGGHAATSVAELLADRGCAVTISTPAMVVAQDLGTTLDMELFHRRAHRAGIALVTDRVVLAATARPGGVAVRVLEHTTGAVAEVAPDWVVTAVPAEPRDELWPPLRDRPGPAVHRVGDCLAPRLAADAVRDGHRVGLAV
ncbi:mycofactocin system FadH/OYE family oxidoreductase 2 [Pseudonocardia humida]|uniref:Mycofactocin system FadH/OYE family oxidoreductase 2 n=1 Tax=Pseudonocardia humida TaxID=2800819 RepID=A0ABT1A203_9PSEU|nr:mycofactocin system FadH/OYE family oxidoreductase 2 [Pseudonocardia humida]MCO1656839.1 mycofactocin system FadH/OYE family oxidoreductase 2 [Pseudonocardia humida]